MPFYIVSISHRPKFQNVRTFGKSGFLLCDVTMEDGFLNRDEGCFALKLWSWLNLHVPI